MFYDPRNGHGLPHDPFKAIVAPRPIGWISTVNSRSENNIAPYSFFAPVSGNPPMLMFSSEGRKDSMLNAEETGEFVFNLSTLSLSAEMNQTAASVGPEVDEFELAKLETAPCVNVRPLRVAASPAAMECKVLGVQRLADLNGVQTDRYLVIGQVVGVHINEDYLVEGLFDTAKAQPLARCGYLNDYAAATEIFAIKRPG